MTDDIYKNGECPMSKYVPVKIDKVPRIIAIGDIHGDYKLALKLLEIAKVISVSPTGKIAWIGGSTHVVQTGDQLDGCRYGSGKCYIEGRKGDPEKSDIKVLKLFTDLDVEAQKHNGRVISLFGNHEINNVISNFDSVSQDDVEYFSSLKNRACAFEPGNEMAKLMGCTRLLFVIIGSNFFCHGGLISPFIKRIQKPGENPINSLERVNRLFKKWLVTGKKENEHIDMITGKEKEYYGTYGKHERQNHISILWDRILGHIKPNTSEDDGNCKTEFVPIMKMLNLRNMIIGHTPQIFLNNNSINGTCNERLWRVDNALSDAFDEAIGVISERKKYQVLEITNDNIFNIISK